MSLNRFTLVHSRISMNCASATSGSRETVGQLPKKWVMGAAEKIAKLLCYNLIAYVFPNGAKKRGQLWTTKPTKPQKCFPSVVCQKIALLQNMHRQTFCAQASGTTTHHHWMNYICCTHPYLYSHIFQFTFRSLQVNAECSVNTEREGIL